MSNPFTSLADASRQPLKVGTPPAYIFTDNGTRYPLDLIALSVQLRTAEALERIANILEASMPAGGPVNSELLQQLTEPQAEGQPS